MNTFNEPSLDHKAISDLKEATEDMFNEIIEVFLEDTPNRLKSLSKAIDDSDLKLMSEESHGIKGSSGNIGARRLSKICEVIERESKEETISNQKEYLQLAVDEFDTVVEEFSKLLSGSS